MIGFVGPIVLLGKFKTVPTNEETVGFAHDQSAASAGNDGSSHTILLVAAFAAVAVAAILLRRGFFNGRPFWLDEAWVADSTRTSPAHALWMAFSGPPLWESLLRLVPPIGGPERYRVVPFLFSLATMLPAAAIGARINRGYALAGAVSLAVLPQLVYRQDLKQYTTEAFVALLLVWLLARLEADWSVRRLTAFALLAGPIVLFATTAVLVNAAVLGALCLMLFVERRSREALVTTAAGLLILGTNALLISKFSLTGPAEALRRYWAATFIPSDRGVMAGARFALGRLHHQLDLFHLPWWVVVGLTAAGIVALWRHRMRSVAIAGPILLVVLVFAAVVKRFPFMDERTSLFAIVILGLYAGLGVAAIASTLMRRKATAGIAVVGLCALGIPLGHADVAAARPNVPLENTRAEVAYVLSHRGPQDVIVVNYAAAFGFSYYWPEPAIYRRGVHAGSTNTFSVEYPVDRRIVVTYFLRRQDIADAISTAFRRLRAPGRVWVLLSHDPIIPWTKAFPAGVSVERIPLRSLGRFDAIFKLTPRGLR